VRYLEQAVPLLEELVCDNPGVVEYQERLARAVHNLATSHNNQRHADMAMKVCQRGLPGIERLAREHPDVPLYRNLLAGLHIQCGQARAQRGDHRQAAAEAESALATSREPKNWYNAACLYCAAAKAVRQETKTSASERQELAGQYLERAMGLLREAEQADYFKEAYPVKDLKSDPDLDPLRERQDFKQLLQNVDQRRSRSQSQPS
jgi:hypothetical protein